MNDLLTKQFEKIGARLEVVRHPRMRRAFDLNIRRDRRGEVFTLHVPDSTEGFRVLQANAAARHLLLLAPPDPPGPHANAPRLLCGHDERHWFVAPIRDRVSTISDAKRSLLPDRFKDISLADLHRRRNARFKRQGEWIFEPTERNFDAYVVLHGEPLQRARSKPHIMAEAVRFGGQPVVLCGGREYSDIEWANLVKQDSSWAAKHHNRMIKDPEVFARGAIRHADHATLILDTWHRVFLNNEARAAGVSFYD